MCRDLTLEAAANDDFWRYLSIKVIPDVVAERWGYDNESHYWSKPARIWLRSIGGTYICRGREICRQLPKVLETPCFTTDSILNFRGKNRT